MRHLLIAIVMAGLLLASCSGGESTPWPSPTGPPGTGEPTLKTALQPKDVFAKVSPAVAFIETPSGTGSGVVFGDGYIATCAYVVWPYTEARVVLPDGSEYIDAPVVGTDLLSDLAVIGPIDTGIDPLPFVDGEDIEIGNEMYLIGYPMEPDEFPQPAISEGLLSRIREWDRHQMTCLQTSTDIDGGQSGGVLVSQHGDVVGMSGYAFGETFALSTSAKDLSTILDRIIAGDDVDGLGDRTLQMEGGQFQYEVELANYWDEKMFVVNEQRETLVNVHVTSDNDAIFWLIDMTGERLLDVDEEVSGMESASAKTEYEEPYFFIVGQCSQSPGRFEITTNCELTPYQDPDDGRPISVGDTLVGNLDYPADYDWFELHLDAGQAVRISVDSVLIDPYLDVDYLWAPEDDVVSDDDSGGGIFGTNAELVYEAPRTGDYFVVVSDAYDTEFGGYYISVASVE